MKHILLISLFLTGTLFADFKVGDKLPAITLHDQFDKEFRVEDKDRLIIMAFEKDVSIAISNFLKTKPLSFLKIHHAKYISDISAMPSFISSMFALPKMKKFPFSVLLIKDDFGKQFNRLEGKITVYQLKGHKIHSIRFLTPEKFPFLFTD